MEESSSELVEKGLPCEDCGSSDALALYDDGHTYCFSCSTYHHGDNAVTTERTAKPKKDKSETRQEIDRLLEDSQVRALPDWKITQATTRHADYRTKIIGPEKGYHLATLKDEKGEPCFVKVRVVTPENDKADFFGIGDQDRALLWGHETLAAGGKMVVVTEGEKDRLAGLQLWSNAFPVVALPFGALGSEKAFARTLEKLSRYDKVIIATDMDEDGREAALVYAKMLPPGKAYIADFPNKDLHETVKQVGAEIAKRALYNAAPYAPDGVVDADEVDTELDDLPQWGDETAYDEMTDWTLGFKGGQVWVGGAGTGIGKSDHAAEHVAKYIRPTKDGGVYKRAAIFNYESDKSDTLRLVLTKLWSKNFSVPAPKDGSPNLYWTPADLAHARAYRRDKCAKLFINDHKGAISWDAIKQRARYLRHVWGVTLIVVDPVAALVATADDDRKALDLLFADAKALAEELDITIHFFSHLTRPAMGKGHEEGGRVELRHFRGSGAITMWADVVYGVERDTQAEDVEERCTSTIRMLKIRKRGANNGKTFQRVYNDLTGRQECRVLKMEKSMGDFEEPPVEFPVEEGKARGKKV